MTCLMFLKIKYFEDVTSLKEIIVGYLVGFKMQEILQKVDGQRICLNYIREIMKMTRLSINGCIIMIVICLFALCVTALK